MGHASVPRRPQPWRHSERERGGLVRRSGSAWRGTGTALPAPQFPPGGSPRSGSWRRRRSFSGETAAATARASTGQRAGSGQSTLFRNSLPEGPSPDPRGAGDSASPQTDGSGGHPSRGQPVRGPQQGQADEEAEGRALCGHDTRTGQGTRPRCVRDLVWRSKAPGAAEGAPGRPAGAQPEPEPGERHQDRVSRY